ncbi:LPS-assembly lipoprotein LptE [Marinomonas transparens]|uniref:LPS-assembly lipoprotein LptE n=1 Tax=Marinomonas transparens TaxID=2795388 RepID=A0A934JP99_9GAMM|nr:hypothetical protein [Marinomonas transparens]MBJ7539940.1 hypothetical protein [Marinomonas transparens]
MTGSFTQTTRLLFLAFVTMSMVACGFHLRGQINIPTALKTLILNSQSGSDSFDRALRIALTRAGVTLVNKADATEGILELKVNAISSSDTTLARNSSNDVTQIQRRLSSNYFVRQADGKALYGPRNISTSKTLANQNAEESTKAAYNKEQTEAMGEDLANQLIYDLGYAPL